MADPLRDVDILIKAFLRPDCVRRLVDSILHRYPEAHLNIADDGEPGGPMLEYYAELATRGDEILLLPFNVGISAGRNAMVDASTRPYLMLLDDDYVFTSQTRIETMVEVLEADRSIGVVGGSLLDRGAELRSYEFRMQIDGGLVHCFPVQRTSRMVAGHVCYDTEIVNNFALFRREVFASVRWDPILKTKEHEDFFLRLSETPWKAVHVPSVVADHLLVLSPTYEDFRMNQENEDRFHRKWGTTAFVVHTPEDRRGDRRWRRRVYASSAVHAAREHRARKTIALLYTAVRAEAGRCRRAIKATMSKHRPRAAT